MSTLTIRTVVTPDEPDPPVVSQVFAFGGAELWITPTDGTLFVEDVDVRGLKQLRDLAALLAHPDVATLLNA